MVKLLNQSQLNQGPRSPGSPCTKGPVHRMPHLHTMYFTQETYFGRRRRTTNIFWNTHTRTPHYTDLRRRRGTRHGMGLRRTDGLLQTDTKRRALDRATNTPEEGSFFVTESRRFAPVPPQSTNARNGISSCMTLYVID